MKAYNYQVRHVREKRITFAEAFVYLLCSLPKAFSVKTVPDGVVFKSSGRRSTDR